MLKKKRQRKYFDDQWKAIRRQLSDYAAKGGPERLHKLRVAIKKVRALEELPGLDGKKMKKHFRPLKKIFDEAGEIRAAHVNVRLAKEHGFRDAAFMREQRTLIRQRTKPFREAIPDALKEIKSTHDYFLRHFGKITHEQLKRFFAKEGKHLEKELSQALGDELHHCRKRVKNLLYLDKLLGKKESKRFHFDHDYLDALQETLGNWHDTALLAEYVKATGKHAALRQKLSGEQLALLRKVRLESENFARKAQS